MLIFACVVLVGWLLAATIGSWAYFAGDHSLEGSLIRKI